MLNKDLREKRKSKDEYEEEGSCVPGKDFGLQWERKDLKNKKEMSTTLV